MTNWYDKPLTSKQKDAVIEDLRQENASLLHLLAQIREACGDNGKRMQDELVAYIRDERQGHISHVALLKASLSKERHEAGELREALRPFAREFADWDGVGCWDEMTLEDMYGHAPRESSSIKFADLRRAAALLERS